ncbi:hypothetical protein BHE74_00029880 [Ensete ventricosum]|nr:hypothetical protein GW17_00002297 [Ensete ventricosum]RWW62968.1 hypothetical protein BHE74_00029880 [Ensete ventricosum]RZR84594.1 hypothetical protein BHM03_00011447 [Ensete ventricosum]
MYATVGQTESSSHGRLFVVDCDRTPVAMTKVHPHATAAVEPPRPEAAEATVLTVWRKSLLFNGNGFTVFDSKGHLVFRVDNYSSGSRDCVVLMDGAGKPLLTIRRKVPNPTKQKPNLCI